MPISIRTVSMVIIGLIVGLVIGVSLGITVLKPSPTIQTVTYTLPVTTTITSTLPTTTTLTTTITTTVGGVKAGELKIAFLVMGTGYPYWDIWIQGIDTAVNDLKQLGFPVSYTVFDGRYDPKIQYDQLLSAIGKFNAVILTPVDREGIQPAIEEARKAGLIIVVADNSVVRRDLMNPFIGSDHQKGAELEAKALIECLRKSGKPTPWKLVVIHGVTSAAANVLRLQGYYNVLKPFIENGTIKVVDVQCGEDRTDKAYNVMLSILAKGPVDAVISTNDEQAVGVVRALEDSGYKPGIDTMVAGFNAISEAVNYVKEGKMCATIAQAPFMMGYWSVMTIFFEYYFGFDPVKAGGGKNWIETPVVAVTKDNADTFQSIVMQRSLPPLPNTDTSSIVITTDVSGLIESFKKG